MYLSGHFILSIYLIWKVVGNLKIALIFSIFNFLPDLDVPLRLKHRTLTHTILIIPFYIFILLILNELINTKLKLNEVIFCSLALYFSHIIPDIMIDKTMIFPKVYVNSFLKLKSLKEKIIVEIVFSIIIFSLFLVDYLFI